MATCLRGLGRADAEVEDASVEAAVHGQVVRQQAEVVVLVAAHEELQCVRISPTNFRIGRKYICDIIFNLSSGYN